MSKKVSTAIIQMADLILNRPVRDVTTESAFAALMLATIAWNREVQSGDIVTGEEYQKAFATIKKEDPKFMKSLKSRDCEGLITTLRKFKRLNFPDDQRIIRRFSTTQSGTVRIESQPQPE
ncbi:hypothetical protein L0128_11680 [candidate division KSB1 bacterium]|nr:hypothetical protein [candidate division KSB1 bacterium]